MRHPHNRLKRHLADISVADVISAVDGEAFDGDRHNGTDRGVDAPGSVKHDLWQRVDDRLRDYLRSVTLESVLTSVSGAADVAERTVIVATVPHVERAPLRHEDRPAAIA